MPPGTTGNLYFFYIYLIAESTVYTIPGRGKGKEVVCRFQKLKLIIFSDGLSSVSKHNVLNCESMRKIIHSDCLENFTGDWLDHRTDINLSWRHSFYLGLMFVLMAHVVLKLIHFQQTFCLISLKR